MSATIQNLTDRAAVAAFEHLSPSGGYRSPRYGVARREGPGGGWSTVLAADNADTAREVVDSLERAFAYGRAAGVMDGIAFATWHHSILAHHTGGGGGGRERKDGER